MRSTEPRGHGPILAGMWNAARTGRLAHAFGFFGPDGVGKYLAAERLVLGLVCASGPGAPCLACGACKRAISGSHPDILVLDPVSADVEEIYMAWITPRDEPDKDKRPVGGVALDEFLSLRPLEGGWRSVLVREAHRIRTDGQNALLKTLEEPGDDVLIVLETSRPEELLPTVRSRLVAARFGPLESRDVLAILAGESVAVEDARELTAWSRGSPGRALGLARSSAGPMWALLGEVLGGRADPLDAAATLSEVEGEWLGRTPTAKARARARAILDRTIDALGDIQRARAGASADRLAHPRLAQAASALSDVHLEAALERAFEARQDVDHNLDPVLAVERALLALGPRTANRNARAR